MDVISFAALIARESVADSCCLCRKSTQSMLIIRTDVFQGATSFRNVPDLFLFIYFYYLFFTWPS